MQVEWYGQSAFRLRSGRTAELPQGERPLAAVPAAP